MVGANAGKVCSFVQFYNVSESSQAQLSQLRRVPKLFDLKFAQRAVIQRSVVFALILPDECLSAG
jgi:hypothetical protein